VKSIPDREAENNALTKIWVKAQGSNLQDVDSPMGRLGEKDPICIFRIILFAFNGEGKASNFPRGIFKFSFCLSLRFRYMSFAQQVFYEMELFGLTLITLWCLAGVTAGRASC